MSDSDAAVYWQDRATKFAHVARGLPAVCAYGMPRLYNEAIHACQSRALVPWLDTCTALDVLDVGCGVGRWSLRLAKRGNRVVGVDISRRMVEVAKDRGEALGLDCEFLVRDVVSLDLGKRFDFILGVTVLQHVVEERNLAAAAANLSRHLDRNGRLVLLEVAPSRMTSLCDSATFRARTSTFYANVLAEAGLRVTSVAGVDVAVLRPYLLPAAKRLPAGLARALLAASTALSLPFDLLASRYFPNACWHKVIVAEHQ